MNEQEWLESADPVAMLKASYSRRSYRKLRLFAVACCQRIRRLLREDRCKSAIDVAERYADSNASDHELRLAKEAARAAHRVAFKSLGKEGACLEWAAVYVVDPIAYHGAKNVSWMAAHPREFGGETGAEYPIQAILIRDIFGNPFRPVAINPAWLSSKVQTLAQSIYAERHFTDMPLLADALEEAGCTDADILNHCRQPAEHVRGCWVVDLLLGKM